MRAHVEAYGCAMNVGEAREAEEALLRCGYELSERPEGADLQVLVSCVVIEASERHMLKRLGALRDAGGRLLLTGCMATTACRVRAMAVAPEAELIQPGEVPDFLSRTLGVCDHSVAQLAARHPAAITPIAQGCLGTCTYCITRVARGTVRSYPIPRLVEKVRDAVVRGPREIRLAGQDTAAYGRDVGTPLPLLLRALGGIQAEFRVRVGMMNPATALPILDELVEAFGDPRIFKFLHLPLQSGSDRLLSAMGRGYTVEEFFEIIRAFRRRFPELTLSTDLIAGFPGETAADHRESVEALRKAQPEVVNVTRFSPRPGTPAASFPNPVHGRLAKARSRELTCERFAIALEKHRRWIGQQVRAFVTEPGKPGTTIARTDEYRQVVLPGVHPLGSFVDVVIQGATPIHLVGAPGREAVK